MAENDGKIHDYKRASQQIDYSGLLDGKVSPTDVDGWLELGDRCHVFLEYKLITVGKIPGGQELAFKRLMTDLNKVKPAICIIAYHSQSETVVGDDGVERYKDIDGAGALVSRIYGENGKEIIKPHQGRTVKDVIQRFLKYVDKHYEQLETKNKW
jgi:hypothetical protein